MTTPPGATASGSSATTMASALERNLVAQVRVDDETDLLPVCNTGFLFETNCRPYVHPANRILDFVRFEQ